MERGQKTARERALDLVRLLVPEWRPNSTQVLWTVRITIVLLILILIGYPFEITLWNWVKLLIIPVTLALVTTVGGAWFTRERARDTALQAYLDEMSELLIDKQLHRESRRYADTRVTARARTLAVLSQLDGKRKRTVLLFLREARLINREKHILEGRVIYPCIVGLDGADLTNAKLRGVRLISTNRKEPVSLQGAVLENADLSGADLQGADLREAELQNADLTGADLSGADVTEAKLRGANLRRVKLGCYVRKDERKERTIEAWTDLSSADLSEVDLSGAIKITRERLQQEIATEELEAQAKSLKGATMPDGTVHD